MNNAHRILAFTICLGVSSLVAFKMRLSENKTTYRVVDMPEEINLVSRDSGRPSKMIAWISNDTLHVGFAPHHR